MAFDKHQSSDSQLSRSISLTVNDGHEIRDAVTQSRHLPLEIMLEILSYLPITRPSTQATLHSICLLNNAWYQATIARLYYQPYITGRNFDAFVRTICPSINAHIKRSDLAALVHVLDLSRLVHHSSKSTTARLLGRVKPNLTWFRAPASSFGLSSFAALNKCSKLEILDLALVNDAISMRSLADSLKKLPSVRKLVLPRSGLRVDDFNPADMVLPPKLQEITLQGGVTDSFLRRLSRPFQALSESLTLSIIHCPHITAGGIGNFLAPLGARLRSLRIANIPLLGTRHSVPYLDGLLTLCPVEELSISSDYVTWLLVFPIESDFWEQDLFLAEPTLYYDAMVKHAAAQKATAGPDWLFPLRALELTSSGSPNVDPSLMIRPKGTVRLYREFTRLFATLTRRSTD